jgi:hypothetical protein
VNENIRPVITSDESVALGVVEPFHLAFELSHRDLPFLPLDGVDERRVWGIAHLSVMTRIRRQRFIGSRQRDSQNETGRASLRAGLRESY